MPSAQSEAATVKLHGKPIGFMRYSRGTTSFQLADEYFSEPRRPTLGQVFEEEPSRLWRQAQRVPAWFSNLLPEGRLRERLAQMYGVSPRNEFRMLLVVGADLPGAVSIEAHDEDDAGNMEVIGGDAAGTDDSSVVLSDDADLSDLIRFSVAGVQLKLSMLMSAGGMSIAGPGILGNRLVKFPSRHYADIPKNEFAMMTWARESGIDTPPCELVPGSSLGTLPHGFEVLDDSHLFVVERFDRAGYRHPLFEPDGQVADRAVHIEDFNQILDRWPDSDVKYQLSFERLGRIIAGVCGHEDFLEFVRRLTFCISIGNEDAHLKNWSVWYPDRITPKLAPAYDLVSTIQYQDLSRDTGLLIGGDRRASAIDMRVMEGLAAGTSASSADVRRTVSDTLERTRAAWFEIGGDLPISPSFREVLLDYQQSVPLLRPLWA